MNEILTLVPSNEAVVVTVITRSGTVVEEVRVATALACVGVLALTPEATTGVGELVRIIIASNKRIFGGITVVATPTTVRILAAFGFALMQAPAVEAIRD